MNSNPSPPVNAELEAMLVALCRNDQWSSCLECLKTNPWLGTCTITMNNYIATTLMHQAITGKGDVHARAEVVLQILSETPYAAALPNGFGSLCLHSVCQRNVKMDSKTKEKIILALIDAFPGGLVFARGVGKRTPLHVLFTNYVSLKLVNMMIQRGKQAAFMKDSKGYLPLHIAASRFTSPSKLQLLLDANPQSIVEKTNRGKTALDLAKATATANHPNFSLIKALAALERKHFSCVTSINDAAAPKVAGADMPYGTVERHHEPPLIERIIWHVGSEGCEKNAISQNQTFKVIDLSDSNENDCVDFEIQRDNSRFTSGQSAVPSAGSVNNPNTPNFSQGFSGVNQNMKYVGREDHQGSEVIQNQAGMVFDTFHETRIENNLEFEQRTNSRDTSLQGAAPIVKKPRETEDAPGAQQIMKKIRREGQRERGISQNRSIDLIDLFDVSDDDDEEDEEFATQEEQSVPRVAPMPRILFFRVTVIDVVDDTKSCFCFSIKMETSSDVTLQDIRSALDDNDIVDYEFKFYVPTLGVLSPQLDTWDAHNFFSDGDGKVDNPYQITLQKMTK